eukprot:4544955-Amphidinium_carterae.1
MPKSRSTVSVSCSSFSVSELASSRIATPHLAFDGTVVPVGSSILKREGGQGARIGRIWDDNGRIWDDNGRKIRNDI